jgi:hypothetical protein
MITMESLKKKVSNRDSVATRFSIYYNYGSKPAVQMIAVRKLFTELYGETPSYSVMIAHLLDNFISNYKKDYKFTDPS